LNGAYEESYRAKMALYPKLTYYRNIVSDGVRKFKKSTLTVVKKLDKDDQEIDQLNRDRFKTYYAKSRKLATKV
jgi:hypothetical protein